MIRPGIKDETLAAAGIIHVDAERAEKLTGLAAPGLYIPYRTIDGHLVIDKLLLGDILPQFLGARMPFPRF